MCRNVCQMFVKCVTSASSVCQVLVKCVILCQASVMYVKRGSSVSSVSRMWQGCVKCVKWVTSVTKVCQVYVKCVSSVCQVYQV